MSAFDRFPFEILQMITNYMQERELLAVIINRRFRIPAQNSLYEQISVREIPGIETTLTRFSNAVAVTDLREMLERTRIFTANIIHNPAAPETRHCHLFSLMRNLQSFSFQFDTLNMGLVTSVPDISIPHLGPPNAGNFHSVSVGGPASPGAWAWNINNALSVLRKHNIEYLNINNANTVIIADIQMTAGRPNTGVTNVRDLRLWNCHMHHRGSRALQPNALWNDVATILAHPRQLDYLSVSMHWHPDRPWDGVTRHAHEGYHLAGIINSPHAPFLVGLRFDLFDYHRRATPHRGMNLLTNCIYLETAASHLQWYDSQLYPQFIIPRANHFRNGDYTRLLPPKLQVLKVTLSVADFPVLDQLRLSTIADPFQFGNAHLPVLHEILAQMAADRNFLPDLRRIIIEDRYNEPEFDNSDPPIAIPRTPLIPNTSGYIYNFLFRYVYGWRPVMPRRAALGQLLVPRIVRDAQLVGVEVVFTSHWEHFEANREDGYAPLWLYPEQIAPGPYVAP